MCSVTSSVLSVSACLALHPATQHHCDEVPEGRPSLAFCSEGPEAAQPPGPATAASMDWGDAAPPDLSGGRESG